MPTQRNMVISNLISKISDPESFAYGFATCLDTGTSVYLPEAHLKSKGITEADIGRTFTGYSMQSPSSDRADRLTAFIAWDEGDLDATGDEEAGGTVEAQPRVALDEDSLKAMAHMELLMSRAASDLRTIGTSFGAMLRSMGSAGLLHEYPCPACGSQVVTPPSDGAATCVACGEEFKA